jgi:hypothetical protein
MDRFLSDLDVVISYGIPQGILGIAQSTADGVMAFGPTLLEPADAPPATPVTG